MMHLLDLGGVITRAGRNHASSCARRSTKGYKHLNLASREVRLEQQVKVKDDFAAPGGRADGVALPVWKSR